MLVYLWQRLDRALEQLAAQIQRNVPAMRYSCQHGSNDRFPWWVVARFANGTEENKVVDISIDCRGTANAWCIRADLARENGFVLRELPAREMVLPGNEEQRADLIE